MDGSAIREALSATAVGATWWALYRLSHKHASQRNLARYYFITAPSWLTTICGRPLPDDRLELGAMLGQIGSLLLSIAGWPMLCLRLNHSKQVAVYLIIGIGMQAIPILVSITVALIRRLE